MVLILVLAILGGAYWYWQNRNRELEWQNISAGTLTFEKTSIAVEVANTVELKKQGLGGRESIDDKSGMLFVFDQLGNAALNTEFEAGEISFDLSQLPPGLFYCNFLFFNPLGLESQTVTIVLH